MEEFEYVNVEFWFLVENFVFYFFKVLFFEGFEEVFLDFGFVLEFYWDVVFVVFINGDVFVGDVG